MKYQLDADVHIQHAEEGPLLVRSRPLRMIHMGPQLQRTVQHMQKGWATPKNSAEQRLMATLVAQGFAHESRPSLEQMSSVPSISIVIPVKDRAHDLSHCLVSLQHLDYPGPIEIIVVDDGSTDTSPQVAQNAGAMLVHSGTTGGGPALARNQGAARATGDILAFLDSDCTASSTWLRDLIPIFEQSEIAAVGGRVDGMHHERALDRYEHRMSSLNLGNRAMTSTDKANDSFYLPSCNLLVRSIAFHQAMGFRADMHVGEDVDLCWRFRGAGWKIHYEPTGSVQHAHRSRLWSFMKRRFEYGTSEGLLHQRHPARSSKRMIFPTFLGASLIFAIAFLLASSPLALLASVLAWVADVIFVMRQPGTTALGFKRILGARLRALASLGYYSSYHLIRYYSPALILACVAFPRLILVYGLMLLGASLTDYRVRRPALSAPVFIGFYIAEQLAYGAGAFVGCLRNRAWPMYKLKFLRSA